MLVSPVGADGTVQFADEVVDPVKLSWTKMVEAWAGIAPNAVHPMRASRTITPEDANLLSRRLPLETRSPRDVLSMVRRASHHPDRRRTRRCGMRCS
jgi:hypothetical protein